MQQGFTAFPPRERWNDWEEGGRKYSLVATTCFNCEAACGLLAYVDQETRAVRKFEGNPAHPGSRGRNCAKGPATLNQITDPERVLYPLRRVGQRGEGKWERVSWDDALDDLAARIRAAITGGTPNKVMYHVGRPGEDGYTERVLAAWGVDGHNSHTNICSAGARAGYAFWMGMDRPSPDYANARCILLISSHLESGHYFNPHAQRIIEAKQNGATIIVMDPRLSNTATHADHWLPTYPGSEVTVLLAIANELVRARLYDREFVRRWVNWDEYLRARGLTVSFEEFEAELRRIYGEYTPERAEAESGVPAATIVACARAIGQAGSAFSAHNWRAAAAGNLGGWMTARCLFFLNVLTGSVGTRGGTVPNAWTKYVPAPYARPPHPTSWNELTWPKEYPLAFFEMSFLLPHFLKEGRGSLDVYFTRVYNPVWTNPDGFTWMEVLRDESLIGRHAALTPVWSETAWLADYVLPVGLGSERHDLASFETHAGSWLGFRQPVQRALKERLGEPVGDTRDTNPGEVWEENEFWIELSWRIDPDGALGIRKHFESPYRKGEKLRIDEYYRWIFEHSVPGLPEAAAAEGGGLTPLEYMRRYGSFEVPVPALERHEAELPAEEVSEGCVDSATGRVYTSRAPEPSSNIVPLPVPPADAEGRRAAGVMIDGVARRGFPTPSGKLEFYSSTLAAWGWPEYAIPTAIRSHVDPSRLDATKGEMALVPTFRLPMLIHTRSGNAKWLNELAHNNPLWIHTGDATRLGLEVGDLVRVTTEIGWFVTRAWVTEGMRPGVVACSHHLGRWRVADAEGTDRWSSALVRIDETGEGGGTWRMRRLKGAAPFASADKDSARVWWGSTGVHQNLTFAVHPDPISGAHAWHQKVTVTQAQPGDEDGDVVVDTRKSHAIYKEWLALARPAPGPDGTRRPHWLLRPLRPSKDAYRFK